MLSSLLIKSNTTKYKIPIIRSNFTQAEKVSCERRLLATHNQQAMDTLNMSNEQYLMSNEELHTVIHLNDEVESKSRTTNRIEWLKKLIRATQIQLKEDESCLAYIETQHSNLKNRSMVTQKK